MLESKSSVTNDCIHTNSSSSSSLDEKQTNKRTPKITKKAFTPNAKEVISYKNSVTK